MEVINLGRSRRFLREKPMRISLFDRPRLTCEAVCLEPTQQETRRSYELSDSLYLVTEGRAHLRAGAQVADLEEQDMVVVPPGVEHYILNPGPGRLTVLALTAPKPGRAGEVRTPRFRAPARSFDGPGPEAGGGRGPRRGFGGPPSPGGRFEPGRGPRAAQGGPGRGGARRAFGPGEPEGEATERPPARPRGRFDARGPAAGPGPGRGTPRNASGGGRGSGPRGGAGGKGRGGPSRPARGRPERPGSNRSAPRTSRRRSGP